MTPTDLSGTLGQAPPPSAPQTPTIPPTTGAWTLTSIQSEGDCRTAGAAIPGVVGVTLHKWPNEEFTGGLIAQILDSGTLRSSYGLCDYDDSSGGSYTVHVGNMPDGSPVNTQALTSIWTQAYEGAPQIVTAFDVEPYGAGQIYFGEWLSPITKRDAAACHYVEGSVIVSHSRAVDGGCRTTLKAIVDSLRG